MLTPTFISTSSLTSDTQASIAQIQKRLVDAQKELASNEHADIGLTLGAGTGVAVSLRQDVNQIQSIKSTNTVVLSRMQASQSALETLGDVSQKLLDALTPAQSTGMDPDAVYQQGQAALQSFQDQLNTSLDGQYLFSGINSDVKPLDDYFGTPPPASAQSVNDAFIAKFGMSPDDPNVSTISGSDMQDFLDNQFASLFSDANWSANWSGASDKAVNSRISRTETADTSTTANNPAFRQLAEAFTMVAGLNLPNLSSDAQQAIIKTATNLVGNGTAGVTKVQSFLGVTQQRVSDSNDQIDNQVNFLSTSIDGLEQVDSASVLTQVTQLQTQLEAAYTITSQISKLSIMDYMT